jgi:hypothetical protein
MGGASRTNKRDFSHTVFEAKNQILPINHSLSITALHKKGAFYNITALTKNKKLTLLQGPALHYSVLVGGASAFQGTPFSMSRLTIWFESSYGLRYR